MVQAPEGPDRTASAVLLLELNEAEGHFVDRLVRAGKLPAFSRLLGEGARLRTGVPWWDGRPDRAWRDISPWIVWPSLYTGLRADEHGIVGFGQDTASIQGRCLWDVIAANGISVGVFGCLMSYPPRGPESVSFYVPEGLADRPDCIPDAARPVQEFSVYTARRYSERFVRGALSATWRLLRALPAGISPRTALRTLLQVPRELLVGRHREPERAQLQARIQWEAFRSLYDRYRPRYATLHVNHVAYAQHRYWRAAEPERYSGALSETDRRFFSLPAERDRYERKLAACIERSLVLADEMVAGMMERIPEGGVVLVATGLGQRPMDPAREIHNPVVRLVRVDELLRALSIERVFVRHQMNPDLTVDVEPGADACAVERALSGLRAGDQPLFRVQRRGQQLFLELEVPRRGADGRLPDLVHDDRPGWSLPSTRFVAEHPTNDQSTAHHHDGGLLLAWRKGGGVSAGRKSIPVTDVAPAILSLLGIAPPAWMRPSGPPALSLSAVRAESGEERRAPELEGVV